MALLKELMAVALVGLVHMRYWRGVSLVGYKQLQSNYCYMLHAINQTKTLFLIESLYYTM
jgi:hypothetical protein